MSRLMQLIRRIVRLELSQQMVRSNMLGVVEATYAHTAEDDEHNYELDVRLKYDDLQLNKVPILTSHMGYAGLPKKGDLVLVEFIGGDINQPLITGRLYHADERPPLHKEDDIVFEQRVAGDRSLNHLRFGSDGTIWLQRDVTKPEDNSEFRAGIKFDPDGNIEIKAGEKIVITLTNDSEINILSDGNPINITCDTLTVDGKLEVTGETTVDANTTITGDLTVGSGTTTTISGNTITGS